MRNNLRYTFLILILFTVFLMLLVLSSSLRVTALDVPFKIRTNINYFVPQGWAFFTRNAREEKLYVYKKEDKTSKWYRLNIPGSNFKFFFGLNRRGRRIPLELESILSQIDSTKYIEIEGNIEKQLVNPPSISYSNVKNQNKSPLCCGDLLIQKTYVKPWAWSTFENVSMQSKVIRIYVKCNAKN